VDNTRPQRKKATKEHMEKEICEEEIGEENDSRFQITAAYRLQQEEDGEDKSDL